MLDLLHGLHGTAVELELQHIDIARSFYDCIRTAAGTAHFCVGKPTHQLKG